MNHSFKAYALFLLFSVPAYAMERVLQAGTQPAEVTAPALSKVLLPTYFEFTYNRTITRTGLRKDGESIGSTLGTIKIDQGLTPLVAIMQNASSTNAQKHEALIKFRAICNARLEQLLSHTEGFAELIKSEPKSTECEKYRIEILLAEALSQITDYSEVSQKMLKLSAMPEFRGYEIELPDGITSRTQPAGPNLDNNASFWSRLMGMVN